MIDELKHGLRLLCQYSSAYFCLASAASNAKAGWDAWATMLIFLPWYRLLFQPQDAKCNSGLKFAYLRFWKWFRSLASLDITSGPVHWRPTTLLKSSFYWPLINHNLVIISYHWMTITSHLHKSNREWVGMGEHEFSHLYFCDKGEDSRWRLLFLWSSRAFYASDTEPW